jgi:hypothetical protein
LEQSKGWKPIQAAFKAVERNAKYIDGSDAEIALAACEVLACLKGSASTPDACPEEARNWIDAPPKKPPASLVARGAKIIDRVLSEQSELRGCWDEANKAVPWKAAVEDLRKRLTST